MLSFINTNNLWWIAIASVVAFISSIMAFRYTTSHWFSNPVLAKVWLAAGLAATALGAWFIHAICLFTLNDSSVVLMLTTALCITCLILATLLVSILDLFLRTRKLSAHHSRENLSQMAMVDTLTQLPNRRALMQHLEAATRRSERTGISMALAFIDIDNFKTINDSLGHQVGDEVLQEVAKCLVTAVRGCDEVARIGGDEFVALIEEIKSDEDAITIVERMVNSIREIAFTSHDLVVTASIGVAMFPQDGNMHQLMNAADAAMYRAKRDGKNQFRFFDADIALTSDQLLEVQHDLKSALANDELKLHYQLKIDSITREPVGAEALLRWEHPVKGELKPSEFMPAAERFGMSYAMNAWVIEECCRTLHHLNYLHIPFSISINLSHQQLRNSNLVNEINTMLKRFNLPTSSLIFEITEAAAIKNRMLFSKQLEKFKQAGLKVSIDDFGTQPSSLAYLQDLEVSELKLDRSFIANVESNHKTRGIIQAVVELAHVLELNVVAEGVETEHQRQALADLGCDQMQGYLISRPVTEDRLVRLLKKLTKQFEAGGQFTLDMLKNPHTGE